MSARDISPWEPRKKPAPFLLLGQTTNQVPVICGWIKQWKL